MYITTNKILTNDDILNYKEGDIFVNCTFNEVQVYPNIYTATVPIHNTSPNDKMNMKLGDVYIQAPTKHIKFYGIPTLLGLAVRFTLDGTDLLSVSDGNIVNEELEDLNLHSMMWNIISNILIDFKIRHEREQSIYYGKKY